MTALDALLYDLAFWHWFALAAGLLVIEIAAPGVVFLWLAVAAGATGAAALALGESLTPTWQVVLFAFASIVSVPAGRRIFPNKPRGDDAAAGLNQRGLAMRGAVGVMESDSANGFGRAKFGDGAWPVRIESGGDLSAETAVVVSGAEGARLIVVPKSDEQKPD